MVTRRGKKIKFDIDSSEGELDGEIGVGQSEKPAPKRQRTKKSKVAEDDPAFNSESSSSKGKAKATADQNQLITRRRGKGGKLRDLMNMPVDIFTEVCYYLDPYDLRRLSLTSKRLWDILMTKEAKHIWKTALTAVPDLPECPKDLNEPQYVCLLYSSECYTIGCTSRGTKADWFHRVRFCPACYESKMTNEWHLNYSRNTLELGFGQATLYQVQPYLNSCPNDFVPSGRFNRNRGGDMRQNDERCYLVEAVKTAGQRYEALPPEEAKEYLLTLHEARDYRIETGKAIIQWNHDHRDSRRSSRANEIAAEKTARFASIKAKLLEMGWDEKDFPMSRKEFTDLVLKDQKLTPKVWQNIKPKLEPLLETGRNERLAEEKSQRLANREEAITGFYYQLCLDVMDLPFEYSDVHYLPPQVDEAFAIPSVGTLLENDTETVTEEQWIEVAPDARLMVLKWWRDYLRQLAGYVVNGTPSPPNKLDTGAQAMADPDTDSEGAISGSIEALKAKLSRGSSVFWCKASSCRGIWRFPQIIKHGLSYHGTFSINSLLSQLQQPSPEAQELVKRLLTDLNLDPEAATSLGFVIEGQDGNNFLCMRCDERMARYMVFTELIFHYLDVQRWFDNATEAVRTSPDKCYPSRAVNSELPKIVNDHDWVSNGALLVRQDDKERKEDVLKLRAEFREESLNDPSCYTELIGGGDFGNKPQREIFRSCLLCPKGYGPASCATTDIRLHIQRKHDKEPDLENDTTTLERLYPSNPCPQ